MKKMGLVLVAVLMLVLVAGCGKKQTLSCTQTPEGYIIEFNIGFKGNMVETMDYKYDADLSAYNDSDIETLGKNDFCSSIKDSMEDYKDAFENCKQQIANKHLLLTAELNVDKIAKNTFEKMGSINDAKKELEAQGFACTIK